MMQLHTDALEENLLKSAGDLRLGQLFTLLRDNDPKQISKTTPDWLQDKSLFVLEWPSQSPDLNPTELL